MVQKTNEKGFQEELTYEFNEELEKRIEEDIEEDFFKEDEKVEKIYGIDENYVSGKDAFAMYLNEIGKFETFSREKEKEMFTRLKNGDLSVKEDIFNANARLVVFIAKKYGYVADNNPAIDFEDIVSAGNLGLFKAIEMFDVDLNYRFSTYAYNWIYSFIERYIVNYSNPIRIPAHIYEKVRVFKRRQRDFELKMGREMTPEEEDSLLKEVVGNSKDAIERCKIGKLMTEVVSLNAKTQKGEEPDDSEYIDFVESSFFNPEEEFTSNALRNDLLQAIDECLKPREREVILYRFGFSTGKTMTLEEVGKILNVTRERVRQIEGRAIRTLRYSRKYKHLKEYMEI